MAFFLVTGGSGFLGSALTRRLVHDGHSVRVLDNNSRGRARRLEAVKDDVEFIEADVRDPDAVLRAVRGVDCICHLAYVNGTELFYSNPELVLDIAIRGMLNVIDSCRKAGVGDLVLASSSEVYQTPPVVPTPEDVAVTIPDVTNPRYSYGGGKILCELMAMSYGNNGFQRVVTFRPHNVYGPDMGWEHVVPQLAAKAAAAVERHPTGVVPLEIQGDGSQTRAFVHVDDFTDGLVRVIASGGHREIYHIGTDEELTIAEVATRIVRHLGREVQLVALPEPKGGTPRRCPDISKVRNLGYQPRITFADGIGPVVDWYVQHSGARDRI